MQMVYVCDATAVGAGLCTNEELGQFIVSPDVDKSRSQIITQAIHLKDPAAINYPVLRTGYYCISTEAFNTEEYTGIIEFRNAYGELAAAQIAKLPFYGAMVLVYFFLGMAWGVLYYMNRHDILPVQNYITAILVFLVIEIFMTWLFYDYQNRHGVNTGAKALLVVVSILSAGRNSFSFFLLLIVCMGYGVVKPSLGKTMIVVRWLAIAHFVFGVIYAVASLSITPESAGPLILLVVLPLAGTLTAFYIWTLNSLGATMKDLNLRKQTVKAGMYRKLWWCILISIVVIFAFFFINSWTFAGVNNEDFVPQHWSTRWFILDGWLNLVYLGDVAFVAWVWRPTANNRRFAMSDEVSHDHDQINRLILTTVYRSHKTTKASKSPRCATHLTLTPKTSKATQAVQAQNHRTNRPRTTLPDAPTSTETSRPCPRRYHGSHRRRSRERVLTEKRCLRSEARAMTLMTTTTSVMLGEQQTCRKTRLGSVTSIAVVYSNEYGLGYFEPFQILTSGHVPLLASIFSSLCASFVRSRHCCFVVPSHAQWIIRLGHDYGAIYALDMNHDRVATL